MRGPVLKINRTATHITELRAAIAEFAKTNPYTIVHKAHSVPGVTSVIARLTHPTPPIIDVLVGETLFNLRSALDQIACALVQANGGTDLKNTYFPFADSEEVFFSKETQKKLAGMSDQAKEVMNSFKTYKGADDVMWAMNKLHNTDKHRTLIPLNGFSVGTTISNGHFDSLVLGGPPRPLDAGDIELFRYSGVIHVEPEYHVNVTWAFSGVDLLSSQPIDNVLVTMAKRVATIFETIEKHFFS